MVVVDFSLGPPAPKPAICVMSDIKKKSEEQKDAEATVDGFREDLGPFVVAAEMTRMAMVFTDAKEPEDPIIFANASFLSLTGYERAEVLAQSFNFLMGRGADPEAMAQIEAAFDGSSKTDPEIRYRRKDGSHFYATVFITPVRDESGAIVQHFISFADVTKHNDEQARCKLLIDELNHRVKNALSTMQSIVGQAFRSSSTTDAMRNAIEDRLFGLARAHDLLTRENWQTIGLHDLVDAAMEPLRAQNGWAARLGITGTNVRLPPKATLALSIALNELAMNAVKHGAFSNENGLIHVAWTRETTSEGDRLRLRWEEKGGPPVTSPTHRGFGSEVLERGLAHELEGSVVHLNFSREGVICMIDIPAPLAHGQ